MWSIGDLNRRASQAVIKDFRGAVRVGGELAKLDDRRGTRWMELVDRQGGRDGRDAQLKAVVWPTRWSQIQSALEQAGLGVQVGQRLVLVGRLSVGDRGDLTLEVDGVDVAAAIGERALARQRLLACLVGEDLFDSNRRLAVPAVPLRIGLVASPDSDGHRDLIRHLDQSGFAFALTLRAVAVEGAAASQAIRNALATFSPDHIDVALIVRGGGAKASLDVFNSEVVARAVASAKVPVWTGIGHTADRTVTDEVAHRCCATPTAAAVALVAVVAEAWNRVVGAGADLAKLARTAVAHGAKGRQHQLQLLISLVNSQLTEHRYIQARLAADLQRGATRCLVQWSAELTASAQAIGTSGQAEIRNTRLALAALARDVGRSTRQGLAASAESVASRCIVLEAYDPRRQLGRGWTLTHTIDGELVRSANHLTKGDRLITRFADGTAGSTVTAVRTNGDAQDFGDDQDFSDAQDFSDDQDVSDNKDRHE